jgi:RNA recognition motif-containing protein
MSSARYSNLLYFIVAVKYMFYCICIFGLRTLISHHTHTHHTSHTDFNTIGYCFVDFHARSDAEDALNGTLGLVLHGTNLDVKWGMRNKKLFVYGLAKSAKWEEEVLPLFSQYGAIHANHSQLQALQSNAKCNCGVVSFCSREGAERARDALHGRWLRGLQLSVNWEQQQQQQQQQADSGGATASTSTAASPLLVTERQQEAMCEEKQSEVLDAAASTTDGQQRTARIDQQPAGLKSSFVYTEHPHFSVHISFQTVQVNDA